jgi:putative addiction module component (TIGR02574 family)
LSSVECFIWSQLKGSTEMSTTNDKLVSEICALPDVEKIRLVDAILTDLDKPDPEIDRIWAEEARRRWAAYKAGRVPTISYEEVMAKHRSR